MSNFNLYACGYEGRILILLENVERMKAMTFYRSAGRSDVRIKRAGEVFPILGILGEGDLGNRWEEFYSDMNSGWIIKLVTEQGRNDINSYMGSENMRKTCLDLEAYINDKVILDGSTYSVTKMSFYEWINLVDDFNNNYQGMFIPKEMLKRCIRKPVPSY
jgi:hypothetical protein